MFLSVIARIKTAIDNLSNYINNTEGKNSATASDRSMRRTGLYMGIILDADAKGLLF
jgi:hypothetical protein